MTVAAATGFAERSRSAILATSITIDTQRQVNPEEK
jgi:hypothetical protein